MPPSRSLFLSSPLGTIEVRGVSAGVTCVRFTDEARPDDAPFPGMSDCRRQLLEYFEGERRRFTSLPLVLEGTDFQREVWERIRVVPFGETQSYGQLAERMGRRSAVRAVGTACGRNRVAIIVPCHRVIRSDGRVGDYIGGDVRKEWLLEHERALSRHDSGA